MCETADRMRYIYRCLDSNLGKVSVHVTQDGLMRDDHMPLLVTSIAFMMHASFHDACKERICVTEVVKKWRPDVSPYSGVMMSIFIANIFIEDGLYVGKSSGLSICSYMTL